MLGVEGLPWFPPLKAGCTSELREFGYTDQINFDAIGNNGRTIGL